MSTVPLTPSQWLEILAAEGVRTAQPYGGWETHERDDETGKQFGPVRGVVIHHTVGSNSLGVVYNGTGTLPGPLCHGHTPKTGVVNMISAGRANHAGTFAQNAHDAVLAESPVHPRPDASEPVDANDCYYGNEVENWGDGADAYPWVQYVATVKWATAICRHHGWSQDSVIGHKEGTRRKVDPLGPVQGPDGVFQFTMARFRQDVGAALARPAGVWPENVQEDPEVPTLITGSNAVDVELQPGDWTTLALDADGGHVLTGPTGALSLLVHLYFATDTPADTKIQGVFYLTNADGGSASDYLVIDHKGGGGKQFAHSSPVPVGKLLWFRVRAVPADGETVTTLLHRDLKGHRFTA